MGNGSGGILKICHLKAWILLDYWLSFPSRFFGWSDLWLCSSLCKSEQILSWFMLHTAVFLWICIREKEGRWCLASSAACLRWTWACCPVEHGHSICLQRWAPPGWSSAGVLGHIECIARAVSARWTFVLCLVVLAAWLTLGRDSLILMQSHLYSVSPVMSLQLRFKWSIF